MKRVIHVLQAGFLTALVLWLSVGVIQAQVIYNPYQRYYQAQLFQQNLYMRQLANVQAAQVYGANYGFPNYANVGNPYYNGAYNPAYTPYSPRPYAPAGGIDPAGVNPYTPTAPGYGVTNPYDPYNPYPPGGGPGYGAGQRLMGEADVMRAYGSVINAQESARILREQALQAKLDTRKKAFDLEMYIKANTPTYTQEQERIGKNTLRRIQTYSTPGEVTNGKALNYLLDDLRKFPNKKISLEPLPLGEAVLANLNVTKNLYGIGILRNDGHVTWPSALQERMSVKQRKDLDEQLKDLVAGAYKGQLDVNVLKDVRNEMDKLRDDLVKKVNEIPTAQYMEARRFLQDLADAGVALEKGDAPVQAKFQRFIEGGKSVQEVVDYLVQNGLRFGPATANDEPAYRAVHSVLATYDIAMNSALGGDTRDP